MLRKESWVRKREYVPKALWQVLKGFDNQRGVSALVYE